MTRKRTITNRREADKIAVAVVFKGKYKAVGFDLHDAAKVIFPEGPTTAADLSRRILTEWIKVWKVAQQSGLPRLAEQVSLKLRD